ncbi:MAG: ABC transporter permease, partial [Dehalococcoidia bacterium]|nr:ABC transporter permease [Dehalococcoidia bacterium]
MVYFILKRILLLIPVIVAVSFLVFALLEAAPGDIVSAIIARAEDISPEEIEELIREHNMDRTMFYRYGVYMINLLQGDLGVSHLTGLSVWNMFIQRLPNTLILSFTALVIGLAVAVPMGIIAARNSGKLADTFASVITLIGMSMPVFWIGLLLIVLFSGYLGWLPAAGNQAGIRSIILPAICSALSLTASTARQTRSSMLDILKADFLRTARAKGAPEEAVIRKHALGNAWIPIVTAAGSSLCAQLAGSVVVESVFAWPGIGRLAADAVFNRDMNTILGTVILTTVLYVLVQL